MTHDRVLDWRPRWDVRSNAHRLALFDCYKGGHRNHILRRKHVWLNQGQTSGCTGWGFAHTMILSPHSVPMTDADAMEMYHAAQRNDEWPGENYEGSSVTGVMAAGKQMGYISAYRWAKQTAEAMHGVSYHGAGELGINWYGDMFRPDEYGVVKPTGSLAGGHALAYAGFQQSDTGVMHRLENSWGKDWGDLGGCWIRDADLQRLLDEDGELAFPVKSGKR